MNFKLIIHKGTDLIKFGMTSEEIQSILKIEPELDRDEFELYDYERYEGVGYVYYEKKENILVAAAFEIIKPSKVYLNEVQVIGLKENKAIELFNKHFDDITYDLSYGVSNKYDIIVGFPDSKVYAVNIARKGYRKQESKRIDQLYKEKKEKEATSIKKYKCSSCGKIIKSIDRPGCPKCHLPMMKWT